MTGDGGDGSGRGGGDGDGGDGTGGGGGPGDWSDDDGGGGGDTWDDDKDGGGGGGVPGGFLGAFLSPASAPLPREYVGRGSSSRVVSPLPWLPRGRSWGELAPGACGGWEGPCLLSGGG